MIEASKITVEMVCDVLGRKQIADALGHKTQASVSQAIAAGRFPARWFTVVTALCVEADHPCPARLFNFREAKA